MRLSFPLNVLVMAIALLCSNASAQTPEVGGDGPWAAEFAEARSQATSDRQYEILADDQITQAEYDELKLGWAECMTEGGFPGELEPDPFIPGVYVYTLTLAELPSGATPMTEDEQFDAFNALDGQCSDIMGPVEALFVQVVVNPENEDWLTLEYACVTRNGLIPEDMTQEQYAEASQTGEWPESVSIFSDQFATCFVNPLEIPVNPEATPIAT